MEISEVEYYQHKQSSKQSVVRNPTGLKSLSKSESQSLEEAIESTEQCGKYYYCKFCLKDLQSLNAMRYHYTHRHLLNNQPEQKLWVAHKVKESIVREELENGNQITKWRCTECSKIYKNQPGIRYHLAKHIENGIESL